jgi:hypothetical protein
MMLITFKRIVSSSAQFWKKTQVIYYFKLSYIY